MSGRNLHFKHSGGRGAGKRWFYSAIVGDNTYSALLIGLEVSKGRHINTFDLISGRLLSGPQEVIGIYETGSDDMGLRR